GAGLPRVGIRAPVARAAAAVEQRDAGYDLYHDRTERLRQIVSEHAVGYVRHGGDVGIQRPVVIAADGRGIDPGNTDVLLDDAVELVQGFGGVPGEAVLEGSSVFQVHVTQGKGSLLAPGRKAHCGQIDHGAVDRAVEGA